MSKQSDIIQNRSEEEMKFLLEVYRNYLNIVDARLRWDQNINWNSIQQKFSAKFHTDRTVDNIKEKWKRMKTCTRKKVLDYENRIKRHGQEAADQIKPSPLTFKLWKIMQEEESEFVRMSSNEMGNLGDDARKDGEGGGSIREAGGAFGKLDVVLEQEYFYMKQKQQLHKLKYDQIHQKEFHEQQIKELEEAVQRHKDYLKNIESEVKKRRDL